MNFLFLTAINYILRITDNTGKLLHKISDGIKDRLVRIYGYYYQFTLPDYHMYV